MKEGNIMKIENPNRYTDSELADLLQSENYDNITDALFDMYSMSCINMQKPQMNELDALIEQAKNEPDDKKSITVKIIHLIRSVSDSNTEIPPIVANIKEILNENSDLSVKEIAKKIGISLYYMLHCFKQGTEMTITDYKNRLKMEQAKNMLYTTDKTITEIAHDCGFASSSYFSEMFKKSENVSPSHYRNAMKKHREYVSKTYKKWTDKDVLLFDKMEHIKLLDVDVDSITKSDKIAEYNVVMPSEEYGFLHEAAIIEYHGTLFAGWYNNKNLELIGFTPIRFTKSNDGGKTWTEPETVAADESGKVLYCPPVFGIYDDKLYMLLNQMVGGDLMHSLDLYEYNEGKEKFEFLWSDPVPFKLNTNTYELANGKLMLPGRIAPMRDNYPTIPAVMISDSGKIDAKWRLVKIQEDAAIPDGSMHTFPETSAIVNGKRVYAFTRQDAFTKHDAFAKDDYRKIPLVYISDDNGETWSKPYSHNIPLQDTKIYSGTLSDGRNYIIGNIQPNREKLAIFFSEPGSMKFIKGFVLQDAASEKSATGYHYPVAYESNRKLYVIYTVNYETWLKRGAAISVIDLKEI